MKYALMILQLVPVLMDIIRKLEEILPENNKGAEKLAMLRQIVSEVYPEIMKVWGTIEKVVAVLVRLFNEKEVFPPKPPVIEE